MTKLPDAIASHNDAQAMLDAPRFWRQPAWTAKWGDCDHGDDWKAMSDEGKRAFIEESIEDSHRREYYQALFYINFDDINEPTPLWEDLTEEQRSNIRDANDRYQEEMQEFGRKLAQGDF